MRPIYIFIVIALFLSPILAFSQSKPQVKRSQVKVLETLPHERNAYTQGLFFHNGQMYESTGQYGQSTFRKVDLKTGKVLRRLDFDNKYFVEGSCVLDGRLYILTWKENKCFVYDIDTWKYLGELYNPREGWGLTTDGTHLIMSDGSDKIFYLDPMTFVVKKTIPVKLNGKSIININELEFIDGKIWANVYGDDNIVIINPSDGNIEQIVDCKDILPYTLMDRNTDVLNGIAYNPKDNSIYITGKYWPRMFKIQRP